MEQELARLLHKQGAAGCRTHGEQQSSLFSLAVQTARDYMYLAQLLHNVGGQQLLRGHIILGPDALGGRGPRTSCPWGHLVLGPRVLGDNLKGGNPVL